MDPTVRQRSTRDRPAKAPLSEGAVIEAALAILKSEGLAAVTMRRVAAALDTGAASLCTRCFCACMTRWSLILESPRSPWPIHPQPRRFSS
jgi:hypothetical protein